MVNEYNQENKLQHDKFFDTEGKVIVLETRFDEHKNDHKELKQNKRDNKGWFALVISGCMLLFFMVKAILEHFTSNHPHSPTN